MTTPDQRIAAVAEIRTVRPTTEAAARAGIALRPMDLRKLSGRPVPSPRFLVPGWFPLEAVTGLGGHSGYGKSTLVLQLLACTALGEPWFGLPIRRGKALGLFCEDTEEILHGRLATIAASMGATLADLADNLTIVSRVGLESDMATFDGREFKLVTTALFGHVLNLATELQAGLVVLDSLHDIYGRDEIKRAEARWFVNQLRLIALESGGAVVVPSHPSHSGLQNKTGESGSTAWRAAFRQFIHLDRVGGDDSDQRRLKITKSNYGPDGAELGMRYEEGLLVPDDGAAQRDQKTAKLSPVNRRALDMLNEAAAREGKPAPASTHIPANAVTVGLDTWREYFYSSAPLASDGPEDEKKAKAARKKQFQRATEALLSRGQVGIWQSLAWVIQ